MVILDQPRFFTPGGLPVHFVRAPVGPRPYDMPQRFFTPDAKPVHFDRTPLRRRPYHTQQVNLDPIKKYEPIKPLLVPEEKPLLPLEKPKPFALKVAEFVVGSNNDDNDLFKKPEPLYGLQQRDEPFKVDFGITPEPKPFVGFNNDDNNFFKKDEPSILGNSSNSSLDNILGKKKDWWDLS